MRGALAMALAERNGVRIIPADAGSTTSCFPCFACRQDHPRRCGEHCKDWMGLKMVQGSSPQMRGALAVALADRHGGRIIPADAGSTACTRWRSAPLRDHPRRCGEHHVANRMCLTDPGSSPQMRGARNPSRGHRHHRRIIPADAGSTQQQITRLDFCKDHPRRCGEHIRRPA